jgi:maleylpyruvate isomerase
MTPPKTTLNPDAARTALARHTALLLDTARSLDDLSVESLCDGWSRAHVLVHLARNADAIARLVHWATTGERTEMYPGGTQARNAEIAAGVDRPREAVLSDLADSSARVNALLDEVTGDLACPVVELRGGLPTPATELPFLRLREVVFHHADLEAGFGFDVVEPELVRAFLEDGVERLRRHPKAPAVRIRTDTGEEWDVGEGGPTVEGPPAGMLLWLARRRSSRVAGESIPELPRGG